MLDIRDFAREFLKAVEEGPRIYFAPLIGMIEAIRNEVGELDERPSATAVQDGRSKPRSTLN